MDAYTAFYFQKVIRQEVWKKNRSIIKIGTCTQTKFTNRLRLDPVYKLTFHFILSLNHLRFCFGHCLIIPIEYDLMDLSIDISVTKTKLTFDCQPQQWQAAEHTQSDGLYRVAWTHVRNTHRLFLTFRLFSTYFSQLLYFLFQFELIIFA